ncbi:hypothetical protein ACIHFC_11380 [Streptomyces sp. NPDC052013]|uniref:hypothetical protein n=1 Tax=Streptomyces sp. NPDC052013 TaxID=3365679 RepID=UPI0037CDC79A
MTRNSGDLNELRDIIRRAQTGQDPYPRDPAARITVGRDGTIYRGDTAADEPVSQVHHGTFAAPWTDRRRLAADQRFARTHMPEGTEYIDEPDVRGWAYSITTELDEHYTLFAFFDGREYRVKLVEPALEHLVLRNVIDGHDGHLYADGTICLSETPGAGLPTLEEAYSKSVLWALGMGFVRNGHRFPFAADGRWAP